MHQIITPEYSNYLIFYTPPKYLNFLYLDEVI